jgi:hypothetical protein
MVEYLSGNRIQGSSTLSLAPPATSWKELDRVTLGSAGDSLDSGTFTAKDNIMILGHFIHSDQIKPLLRLGNSTIDTGSNYAMNGGQNGGANTTAVNQSSITPINHQATNSIFSVGEFNNVSSQEKLGILHYNYSGGAGAGTAPDRSEITGKWANTSAQINRVEYVNTNSGSFGTGTELVVLGYDNDEADSGTNFWQELDSVELSATANEINSGTFTAKKYLMVELQVIADGSISGSDLQFNGDTGSNYARRYRSGGDSEATGTSEATLGGGTGGDRGYNTWFIVNVADKEKLAIGEAVWASNGAGNTPSRRELTGKWANTSAQITSIKIKENGSGGWASGSTLKVWGSD